MVRYNTFQLVRKDREVIRNGPIGQARLLCLRFCQQLS